jgi:hypothetical protein
VELIKLMLQLLEIEQSLALRVIPAWRLWSSCYRRSFGLRRKLRFSISFGLLWPAHSPTGEHMRCIARWPFAFATEKTRQIIDAKTGLGGAGGAARSSAMIYGTIAGGAQCDLVLGSTAIIAMLQATAGLLARTIATCSGLAASPWSIRAELRR